MPGILTDSPWTSLFDQCCADTKFAHTLYSYSSALAWVQASTTSSSVENSVCSSITSSSRLIRPATFTSRRDVTENVIGAFNPDQGNPFADILVGTGDYGGIAIYPAVENKSKETGFYAQDDWRVTSKLTLNLGLRYEWSTPYTERNNLLQFSNFTGNSGVIVQGLPLISGPLKGTTEFATSSNRHVPIDRNNWAPRLGFRLPADSQYRGSRRRGHLLRNERRHQLPVSRHRLPQGRSCLFHQGQLSNPICNLGKPLSSGTTSSPRHQVWRTSRLGFCQPERSGHHSGPKR